MKKEERNEKKLINQTTRELKKLEKKVKKGKGGDTVVIHF